MSYWDYVDFVVDVTLYIVATFGAHEKRRFDILKIRR